MAKRDKVQWSKNDFTIREVILRGLPTVVKVNEGFCSEKEEESYSTGDLIKLEKVQTYQNIAVQFLNTEITIPIDSKVKVCVIQEGPLCNVKELMKKYPRFICVERALTTRNYVDGGSIDLEDGDILEIERVMPNIGLVCKFQECEVTLELGYEDKFRVLSEETEYCLHEIVELFKLPQRVFLLTDEISEFLSKVEVDDASNILYRRDVIEILCVQEMDFVFGYNVSTDDRFSSTTNDEQTQVLLPLDKTAIQEMKVCLPINDEKNHCDFLCKENLTDRKIMSDILNGTESTTKMNTFSENDYEQMYDLPIKYKSIRGRDDPKKTGQDRISASSDDYEMMVQPAKYKHLLSVCEKNDDEEEFHYLMKSFQDLRSNATDVRTPKLHFPQCFTSPRVLQKKTKRRKDNMEEHETSI